MPVAMLTRCIVIACAPEVKQSAREKNQSHSPLSEEKIPSRDARTAFPLRVTNVFMHIKNGPVINPHPPVPSCKNEPPRAKMVSAILLRNRVARTAVQREGDGYNLECLVRNAGMGAVAATSMASRQVHVSLPFAESEDETAEWAFQILTGPRAR